MRPLHLMALAWILAAGPACADTIISNFTGLPQDTESGTYNGFAAILNYFGDHPAPTSGYENIYSSLVIYTPTPQHSSNQEFLSNPVPEPATMALFGIGFVLLGLGCARRRRR